MKNIIFIAPPASGKGTISQNLEENFGYVHLSTGDVLRGEVENGNQEIKNLIDNGHLVSDELIASIIEKKIGILKGKPFIIDGCPRTLNQAYMLSDVLEKSLVTDVIAIKLNLDMDIAMKRILGRRMCSCGKTYNIYYEEAAPKKSDICDSCGAFLYQRSDDTEEKVIIRFNEYKKNIDPIVKFYKEKNMLYEVDANRSINEVFDEFKGLIK